MIEVAERFFWLAWACFPLALFCVVVAHASVFRRGAINLPWKEWGLLLALESAGLVVVLLLIKLPLSAALFSQGDGGGFLSFVLLTVLPGLILARGLIAWRLRAAFRPRNRTRASQRGQFVNWLLGRERM